MTSTGLILQLKIPGRKAIELPLDSFPITLGRAPVNDIVLNHPSVSRRHARIDQEAGNIYLEDLASAYGTVIKNKKVRNGERVQIKIGERILLGDVKVKIRRPKTRYTRRRRALGLSTVAVVAFLSFLCAGALLLSRGAFNRIEKPATSICDPSPMPLVYRVGMSYPAVPIDASPASPGPYPPPNRPSLPPVLTVEPGPASLTPSLILPTPPPDLPFVSWSFLEFPFPYDGGNHVFGGTLAQFKQASQLSYLGGRINSYFDHLPHPYPSSSDPAIPGGDGPAEPPIGENILLFDGSVSAEIDYSGHPGYDFSPFISDQATTPVFAAADGVVHSVGIHDRSGARYVKILHKLPQVGSFLTIYWHLHPDSSFEAMLGREGQPITAGTRIGTMGNTGYSAGHYLHFEVRFDHDADGEFTASEVVDPYGFIPNAGYPNDPWATLNGPASNYLWIHPLGVAAMVPESGGGSLDPAADPSGGGMAGVDAALCAPANALPPGGTIYWSWAPDPPPKSNLYGTNHSCVLSVFDSAGHPVTSFDPPVTIRIPFNSEDLANVDPNSLFIHLLAPGEVNWTALPTQLDLNNRVAIALTDRPGKCALLGEPLTDLIPPTTTIDFSGPTAPGGEWYEEVTVTLGARDPSGITLIEYSLDAGTTWEPYTGPFQVQPTGIPQPIDPMDGDFFAGGPGRFLVLASATDGMGNIENPPAMRSLVIDPSKKPKEQTITPQPSTQTPAFTPTNTPTLLPPGPEFACAESLKIIQNANCRTGPGTGYDVVTAFPAGLTLFVDGQNADTNIKWWWVQIPETSGHCWVSTSTVMIEGTTSPSCLPAIADPPTPSPQPTESITPTPPTSTPGNIGG